jgi:hypothetical protein
MPPSARLVDAVQAEAFNPDEEDASRYFFAEQRADSFWM